MSIVFTGVIYAASCLGVIGGTFLTLGSLGIYKSLQKKSMKALVGVLSIIILWLLSVVCLVFIFVYISHLKFSMKGGILQLLLFDVYLAQVIYQWTLAPITTPFLRKSRWFTAGIAVLLAVYLVFFFAFLRS